MSEAEVGAATPSATETCAQCSKALTPEDRVAAGDRVFCKSCYASLRAELEQAEATAGGDLASAWPVGDRFCLAIRPTDFSFLLYD